MPKKVEQKVNLFSVKDVMSGVTIYQDVKESVFNAASVMFRNNAHAIIAVDKGLPVGIVTERDIAHNIILHDMNPRELLVHQVMTTPIIKLPSNTDILNARDFMILNNLRKIPIEEDNQIIGMITQSDIVINIF